MPWLVGGAKNKNGKLVGYEANEGAIAHATQLPSELVIRSETIDGEGACIRTKVIVLDSGGSNPVVRVVSVESCTW